MCFHTGTNEGGIDLTWCLRVLSAAAIPSCQGITQSSSQRAKINRGTFVCFTAKVQKERWNGHSHLTGTDWAGTGTWNENLLLFRKDKVFHITQQALEDQVAANTFKCSLSPHKAPVVGIVQASKGHQEFKNSSHNACPLPLSKSECNLQHPKDLFHQFPCFGMSPSVAIWYPDPWGGFSTWSLTLCAMNNFYMPVEFVKRGAG